jgi:Holliday junction DNA helicase RuvA
MIAFLRGTIRDAGVDHLVVDLGSFGVTVQCTPVTALSLRPGDHVELLTTMVVREDAWTVYGFLDAEERRIFEQVQTVSGIGPRIALALLGAMTPDELRRAVSSSDEATLMSVPGIGRKGAQRLILELADKLGAPAGASIRAAGGVAASGWRASVAAGLTSLGWSAKDAEVAIASLDQDLIARADSQGPDAEIGTLLKSALRSLDRS